MESRELARKYAEALLGNIEPSSYAEAYDDMHTFAELMKLEPHIKLLLGNPGIPDDSKRELIRAIAERAGFLEMSGNMLLLLLERERMGLLASIAECAQEIIREHEGRISAKVTAAVELSREQSARLRARLCQHTGKNVELDVSVDKTLMGGIVIRVGDKIIDASIINALSGIRQSLIEGW